MTPRRVMILGGPGSGKSTLARSLGAALGIPVVHLDRLYHRPGWVAPPDDVFLAAVARAAAAPAWVIDGNYTATIRPRLAAADALVVLDVPRRVRMARVLRRTLRERGRQRADSAPGCVERFDLQFLRYAWDWDRDKRPGVLAIADRFTGRTEILRSRAAIDRLLSTL